MQTYLRCFHFEICLDWPDNSITCLDDPITCYLKTDVMWCSTNRRRCQLATIIFSVNFMSYTFVRDLCIFLAAIFSMNRNVEKRVFSCFPALCQLHNAAVTSGGRILAKNDIANFM
jgi:hypothetical protein